MFPSSRDVMPKKLKGGEVAAIVIAVSVVVIAVIVALVIHFQQTASPDQVPSNAYGVNAWAQAQAPAPAPAPTVLTTNSH